MYIELNEVERRLDKRTSSGYYIYLGAVFGVALFLIFMWKPIFRLQSWLLARHMRPHRLRITLPFRRKKRATETLPEDNLEPSQIMPQANNAAWSRLYTSRERSELDAERSPPPGYLEDVPPSYPKPVHIRTDAQHDEPRETVSPREV